MTESIQRIEVEVVGKMFCNLCGYGPMINREGKTAFFNWLHIETPEGDARICNVCREKIERLLKPLDEKTVKKAMNEGYGISGNVRDRNLVFPSNHLGEAKGIKID